MQTIARGTKEARPTDPNFVNLSDRTKAYHRHELSDGWPWFTFCKNVLLRLFRGTTSNPPTLGTTSRRGFPVLRRDRPKCIRVRASRHHIFTQHRNNFPSAGHNRNCVCVNIRASRQYRIRCQLARQLLRLTSSLKQTENSHSSWRTNLLRRRIASAKTSHGSRLCNTARFHFLLRVTL